MFFLGDLPMCRGTDLKSHIPSWLALVFPCNQEGWGLLRCFLYNMCCLPAALMTPDCPLLAQQWHFQPQGTTLHQWYFWPWPDLHISLSWCHCKAIASPFAPSRMSFIKNSVIRLLVSYRSDRTRSQGCSDPVLVSEKLFQINFMF